MGRVSLRLRASLAIACLAVALLVTALSSIASRNTAPLVGLVQRVYATTDPVGTPVREQRSSELDVAAVRADPDLPERELSIRWDGYWFVPTSGSYRFAVLADDEVRLFVDDVLVADRHVTEGYRVHVDPVRLMPGAHSIRVEYVQHGGGMALDVRWSPLDGDFRSFAPSRLFPGPPTDEMIMAAARTRTLAAVRSAAWWLALAVGTVLLLVPGAVGGGVALARSRAVMDVGRFVRGVAGNRRLQLTLALGASALAVGWTVWLRSSFINPFTLWADDVWVAALASLPSLVEAVTTHAPIPPGFMAIQWVVRHVSGQPVVSLQLIPLACGVLLAVGLGFAAASVSGSRAVGVAALALGLLDPFMAQVSVFVKQYTCDGLIAVAWLGLAAANAANRGPKLTALVWLALASVLLSFPSIFLSSSLLLLVGIRTLRTAGWSSSAAWRYVVTRLVGFGAGALVIYWFALRPRAGSSIQGGWRRQFMTTSSWDAASDFFLSRVTSLARQALPETLWFLAPLALVGLVWLFVRPQSRAIGWFLLGTYAALFAAAAAGFYPVGTGYEGRVVLFSNPLVLFLLVLGGQAVWSWSRVGAVLNTAAAAAAVTGVIVAAPAVEYFDHPHSAFVDQIVARSTPADGVVMNHRASYLFAVYTDWPRARVVSPQSEGFYVRFDRPLTVTLPPARLQPSYEELDRLLAPDGPGRLFFFSIRRDTAVYEDRILEAGFRAVERRLSTTSAVFAVFERSSLAAQR